VQISFGLGKKEFIEFFGPGKKCLSHKTEKEI
jgi:hypothetical protein